MSSRRHSLCDRGRPGGLTVVWEVVQESGVTDTLLGVSLLGYEEQLLEIEAIAVLK
jgi:hypothetical protein